MLKYWRIILLLVVLFGATMAIGMKYYPYGRNGVEIAYVSKESPSRGILEQGMIITSFNKQPVTNAEDWNRLVSGASGEVSLRANNKDYQFQVNDSLGIDVMDIDRTNLNFGLDLRGGVRIVLMPKENATREMIDQIISIMETRANMFGLSEINFYPVQTANGDWLVQVDVAGISRNIVDDLLSTEGNFEGRVSKPVILTDGRGFMELGQDSFPVEITGNESITIDEKVIHPSDNFTLKGIDFQYINQTQDRLQFLALVYDGDDIEIVYTDPQRSGIVPLTEGAHRFSFTIQVSMDSAQRFADVTTGVPSYLDIQTGDRYLESAMVLYLDRHVVSELRIAESLGGQIYQTPQITGVRGSLEETTAEMLRLQTVLRSGAMPTGLETLSVTIISPALGTDFFESTMYAAILAVIAVVIIIFFRYRNFRIALPMVLISLTEVIIILGISAINDSLIWAMILIINFLLISIAWWKKNEIDIYAWVGALLIPLIGMGSWTIDLPAIAGIIAAIGTGIDHQIIIADEAISGKKDKDDKDYTVKKRIKMAFFIIFGAAATTIAAMFPLMSVGIGFVRGFAITTIVGVLVGVLITRPAYAKIVEGAGQKKAD